MPTGQIHFLNLASLRAHCREHVWEVSRVFPGTERRYWVYVPAQYTASEPAPLMVFQDGRLYVDPEREMRVPIVFDNLIHRGEMPPTIGVFVDPGAETRNAEYDPFSDAYTTFLLTEILPAVQDRHPPHGRPDGWAIGGGSSGGSCAFTAAWMRPDRFHRVLSFLGSFAQIPGGNTYPELIRETPRKPLRVFLQAATRDLNWDAAELNWFTGRRRPRGTWIRLPARSRRRRPRHQPRRRGLARCASLALANENEVGDGMAS
jgi:enterochelin esterase-like enzyme